MGLRWQPGGRRGGGKRVEFLSRPCIDGRPPRVPQVGFDGFGTGKELHYYTEQRMQLQVNAAGALLHDWTKEQAGIKRLIDEGRVVLL